MNAPDLSTLNPVTIAVFTALATLSIVATTVTLYKIGQFVSLGVGKRKRAEVIVSNWLSGKSDTALREASTRETTLLRVLQATFSGLQARPGDQAYAEELGRQTALIELAAMSRRMRILEAVVQAAPMLGLLGTVIGMIDAFSNLAQAEGAVDPALLAGGIWTALTTTAVGLVIALLFYFVSIWLEGRIDGERQSMETLMSAAIYGRVTGTSGQG
ncbi:MAG: MotA/TolQ/ExbB proton channel family protein [Litoreibacter sp.]|uniref:MotA/TolQ/ExbB proton channel family protein n=1 Tax=Litoreibacter sp. TaxID=1969459 RepID=UPI0032987B42